MSFRVVSYFVAYGVGCCVLFVLQCAICVVMSVSVCVRVVCVCGVVVVVVVLVCRFIQLVDAAVADTQKVFAVAGVLDARGDDEISKTKPIFNINDVTFHKSAIDTQSNIRIGTQHRTHITHITHISTTHHTSTSTPTNTNTTHITQTPTQTRIVRGDGHGDGWTEQSLSLHSATSLSVCLCVCLSVVCLCVLCGVASVLLCR